MTDNAKALADHIRSDLTYITGLADHMEAGVDVSKKNIGDLIAMVRWNAEHHLECRDTIETQAREIERLNEALFFVGRWVERGMFCSSVTASEAISCIAHYPGMPWNSQRWDVDHKPYAAAYYAKFPRTAALAGDSHDQ